MIEKICWVSLKIKRVGLNEQRKINSGKKLVKANKMVCLRVGASGERKRGVPFRAPALFRGIVRGKRFIIEGGLISPSKQFCLSSNQLKIYHEINQMSNIFY